MLPARAGLGLTIGSSLRCGAVLPAIADQAGIEAGVAIRKLHRDAVFDGHGAEVLQHIPAVAAACVAAGTGLLRAGIRAALQGDGRIDVVVHRTPAMADVIHHAGLLRGGIHNGNPGAVVEDRMTFLIGQGVAVQVDFDIPAFRDHHVFSQVLIQCNGVQPFVGVFVIRLRSVDGRTDGVIFRRPAVLFHGNGGLLQKNDLLKRHLIRHRGAAIFRDFLPGGVLYTVFRRLRIPFILSVTGGQFRIPVTGLKVLFSLLLFLRIVWLLFRSRRLLDLLFLLFSGFFRRCEFLCKHCRRKQRQY